MDRPGSFTVSYDAQDAKFILLTLLAVEVVLVTIYALLHIALSHLRWGPLSLFFDLDLDVAIPAWFSAMQIFFASMVGFAVARHIKRYRWFVVLCSLGLLFLSVDEGASIHERITEFAIGQDIAFLQAVMIGNHGAWIVPYLVVGLVFALICYKPILYMFKRFRLPSLLVMAGALITLAGAVGLEVISYLFLREGAEVGYKLEVAGEEFFEMAGITLILYGLLVLGLEAQSDSEPAVDHSTAVDKKNGGSGVDFKRHVSNH